MKRFALVPSLMIVAAVVCLLFVYLWSSSAPGVALSPEKGLVGARTLSLKLTARRGLKSVKVSALQGEKRVDLLVKEYRGAKAVEESLPLAQAGLKDGPFTLEVSAVPVPLLGVPARSSRQSFSFTYDGTPPVVSVLSVAHNIIRGGAALVVYTVSKEVEKTGVIIGDRFVPGYRQGGQLYACLFPFPYDMPPEKYVPRVTAVDKAGNENSSGINFHLIVKPFSTDRINLTEQLLGKISSEFGSRYPQVKDPLELFLKVNGALREENRKALLDLAKQTSPVPLWQGKDFLRMPKTAPLGGFAQARTYLYQGREVDHQTHLGFDLASVVQAPVPAANSGKVVFAGDLGIYGQCVVIDHGLGLQTVYAHLSRIVVKVGDAVEKGQAVGNTGATGMAAGDHLHFGVTVAGVEVNPVEWWDPSWIRNNVSGKLEAARSAQRGYSSAR
ncbi:MAG TPA: M23 family metallopeptidase [Verrucomicrobiae bacterium]|nr:M23 family metallopeptidase [Verrucomicrobiae bacterium]